MLLHEDLATDTPFESPPFKPLVKLVPIAVPEVVAFASAFVNALVIIDILLTTTLDALVNAPLIDDATVTSAAILADVAITELATGAIAPANAVIAPLATVNGSEIPLNELKASDNNGIVADNDSIPACVATIIVNAVANAII